MNYCACCGVTKGLRRGKRRRGEDEPVYLCKDEVACQTFEASGNEGSQLVRCGDCGAKWFDIYKLTRYEKID